jgi:4-hydroxybenzoate polyprenyltransferase
MITLRLLFISMRPAAWVQNLLILVPLLFSGKNISGFHFFKIILALLIWCLLSGCMAIINDLLDAARDANHPTNRSRPIAAGRISRNRVESAVAILGVGALVCGFILNSLFGLVGLVFAGLMIAYTFSLRYFALIDILILGIALSLRVVSGYTLLELPLSPWGILPAFSLGITFAVAKRLYERAVLGEAAETVVPVLAEYPPRFLEMLLGFSAMATVGCYMLSSLLNPLARFDQRPFWVTVPLVFYGLLRAWYLMMKDPGAHPPESLPLHDRPILWAVILWVLLSLLIT